MADHPEHDPVTGDMHVPEVEHLSCLQMAGLHSHPIETTDSRVINLGRLNFQLNKVLSYSMS